MAEEMSYALSLIMRNVESIISGDKSLITSVPENHRDLNIWLKILLYFIIIDIITFNK